MVHPLGVRGDGPHGIRLDRCSRRDGAEHLVPSNDLAIPPNAPCFTGCADMVYWHGNMVKPGMLRFAHQQEMTETYYCD